MSVCRKYEQCLLTCTLNSSKSSHQFFPITCYFCNDWLIFVTFPALQWIPATFAGSSFNHLSWKNIYSKHLNTILPHPGKNETLRWSLELDDRRTERHQLFDKSYRICNEQSLLPIPLKHLGSYWYFFSAHLASLSAFISRFRLTNYKSCSDRDVFGWRT